MVVLPASISNTANVHHNTESNIAIGFNIPHTTSSGDILLADGKCRIGDAESSYIQFQLPVPNVNLPAV